MNDGQDRHQRILIPADLSLGDPETESNALRLILEQRYSLLQVQILLEEENTLFRHKSSLCELKGNSRVIQEQE